MKVILVEVEVVVGEVEVLIVAHSSSGSDRDDNAEPNQETRCRYGCDQECAPDHDMNPSRLLALVRSWTCTAARKARTWSVQIPRFRLW